MIFKVLKWIKRNFHLLKRIFTFSLILFEYIKFKKLDKTKRFNLPLGAVYPCLTDKLPYTRFDAHYVYHTAWAARKVKEIDAPIHYDFSSSLYFSAIVSAWKPVKFYDYRPANLNLGGLTSEKADLLNLSFQNETLDSVSCMHTVEHIGLGRYGDNIDPEGDVKATRELSRVLKRNGNLLFVVPIGKPRIEFNAHRIYSYEKVLEMFPDMEVKEFFLIPDDAVEKGVIYHATHEDANRQNYGCGCFWLVKK